MEHEVHTELIINEISSCGVPLLQLQTLVSFSPARAFSHPTSGGDAEQAFTFKLRGLARKSNRNEISSAANNLRAIEAPPVAN